MNDEWVSGADLDRFAPPAAVAITPVLIVTTADGQEFACEGRQVPFIDHSNPAHVMLTWDTSPVPPDAVIAAMRFDAP